MSDECAIVLSAVNRRVGLHVVSFRHTVTHFVTNVANVTFKVKHRNHVLIEIPRNTPKSVVECIETLLRLGGEIRTRVDQ